MQAGMEENSVKLKCEIVTPEGLLVSGEVAMVVVPGEMGELGILPRHAPIVSKTVIGEARIKHFDDGHWEHLAAGNGYVKMQFDRLLLLVDTAEKAVDIDTVRAQAAVERAERWLAKSHEVVGVDVHRAEQSRRRALNRLKVAGR